MRSWKKPTPEQVEKAVALLGHIEQRRYFFDRLENPEWIQPLSLKGFFHDPPQPVRNEVEGTVAFPPWPESRYLARMASRAPSQVLGILIEVSDTDNITVHVDLADTALAMAPQMAAQWVRKELGWLGHQQAIYLLLPDRLGKLIPHLATGGQVDTALERA